MPRKEGKRKEEEEEKENNWHFNSSVNSFEENDPSFFPTIELDNPLS